MMQIPSRIVSIYSQCPLRAWLEFRQAERKSLAFAEEILMIEGARVRSAALAQLSNNSFVVKAKVSAQKETLQACRDGFDAVIRPTFEALGVTARGCALRRVEGGFSLVSVSSHAGVRDDDLLTCAIVSACALESGVEIRSVTVMHLDTHKSIANAATDKAELFKTVDVTETVFAKLDEVRAMITRCATDLNGPRPDGIAGSYCKNACSNFTSCHVISPVANDHVCHLPSTAGAVGKAISAGTACIRELEESLMTNERNALVYASIMRNAPVVTAQARAMLAALPYPRHYIDFEACAYALPKFNGMRAYEPILFQWSLHTKAAPGSDYVHTEFLDVSGQDPRRGFAETLLEALGQVGPVLVFSSFEKTRLKDLASTFPDLADRLQKVIERIVDVLTIARSGFYSPDMAGSWSLKKIAPVLPPCPDLVSYADMEDVADGMAAQAAYMALTDTFMQDAERTDLKTKMLAYCASDTRGLAHLCDSLQFSGEFDVLGDEAFQFVKRKSTTPKVRAAAKPRTHKVVAA